MFKVKKSTKPEVCAAMRCKAKTHANLPEQENLGLCVRHYGEWLDAGSPALGSAPAPSEPSALVPDGLEAQLTTELAETADIQALVSSLPDETQADIDQLTQVGAEAKARARQLEVERTSVTKPLNAVLRQINGWFKPTIQGYEDVSRAINRRLVERQARIQAEQDAALAQIAANGGHTDETTVALAHEAPDVELPKGVGRDVLQVEITDESALPRECMSPDLAKCRALAAEANKHGIEIPGMRYFMRKSGT